MTSRPHPSRLASSRASSTVTPTPRVRALLRQHAVALVDRGAKPAGGAILDNLDAPGPTGLLSVMKRSDGDGTSIFAARVGSRDVGLDSMRIWSCCRAWRSPPHQTVEEAAQRGRRRRARRDGRTSPPAAPLLRRCGGRGRRNDASARAASRQVAPTADPGARRLLMNVETQRGLAASIRAQRLRRQCVADSSAKPSPWKLPGDRRPRGAFSTAYVVLNDVL